MNDNQGVTPDPLEDVKISNTAQRVRAILVVVIVVIAAGAFFFWYSNRQKEIARHDAVKAEFQKAHVAGYSDFWVKAKVDIKGFKNNMEFETRMKQITTDDPVRYAKYLKEECLPIIDTALPKYKAIAVPLGYADKMDGVIKAFVELRESWSSLANDLQKYEMYFKGKAQLDPVANAWLGAQQSNAEKHKANAYKYYRLLGCVLPDKKISELETTEINNAIQESCRTDKTDWFRRVAFECLPNLLEKSGDPEAEFDVALKKSRKAERMDHNSKFGIEDCLETTRDDVESAIIERVAKAWAGYVSAQNSLLSAIDSALKELR